MDYIAAHEQIINWLKSGGDYKDFLTQVLLITKDMQLNSYKDLQTAIIIYLKIIFDKFFLPKY